MAGNTVDAGTTQTESAENALPDGYRVKLNENMYVDGQYRVAVARFDTLDVTTLGTTGRGSSKKGILSREQAETIRDALLAGEFDLSGFDFTDEEEAKLIYWAVSLLE